LAERVVVIVSPQDGKLNLTVEDAMRQVLNAFSLLERSGAANSGVVWRLVEAKTNSPPFSVIAEATSLNPNVNIDAIAHEQALNYSHSFKELRAGRVPNNWSGVEAEAIVTELFLRLRHDITTEIKVGNEPPILLTSADSAVAISALETELLSVSRAQTKSQIGSIDGVIQNVTTWHNKPAIIVNEKKSGFNITCVISDAQAEAIGRSNSFLDAWKRCRVVVRGILRYKDNGDILRIENATISRIQPKDVTLDQIKDADFTSGLNSLDYLSKLGDGELG
jgi:hypothetical protein